jgi:hypothetical protein
MSKITPEFRSAALRRGLIVMRSGPHQVSDFIVFAGIIELANLGYIVPPDDLRRMTIGTIEATVKEVRTIVSPYRDITPVNPSFPALGKELPTKAHLSSLARIVEQILHYWSSETILSNYPSMLREGLSIEDALRNARTLRVVPASVAIKEMMVGRVI